MRLGNNQRFPSSENSWETKLSRMMEETRRAGSGEGGLWAMVNERHLPFICVVMSTAQINIENWIFQGMI